MEEEEQIEDGQEEDIDPNLDFRDQGQPPVFEMPLDEK